MPEVPSLRQVPVAPVTQPGRGFSPVWIIPLVAALLGLWLAWKFYAARGPEITVKFETAEGIVPGKTPVVCRSVNIGTIERIQLTDNLKGVLVTMQMTSEATKLLTKDTQIWVVRPRYGGAGISGLSTIVSGNYIEIEPGLSREPRRNFVGLEQPPITSAGVPGLRIKLVADEAGGIEPGSPITYKGLSAGKIETRIFRPETGKIEYTVFINAEYAKFVRAQSKFWNISGIDLEVGANGVKVRTGTLEALLLGGITFDEPVGKVRSEPVADGTTFKLYDSFEDTKKIVMTAGLPYLLLFTESVRGLSPDAPVEFRGMRVGSVEGISFKYLPDDPGRRVPVLIKIDPSLITRLPSDDPVAAENFIERNVENGLRASLKTGSLLTGQLFVDLDYQKDAVAAAVVEVDGYKVLPTVVSGGLAQLQEKAGALLDKLQALPLEKTVNNASDALASVKAAAQNADKTIGGFNDKSPLYQDLTETIRQLDETLRSLRTLTGTLERKPNSILFGKPKGVPPPKGSPP